MSNCWSMAMVCNAEIWIITKAKSKSILTGRSAGSLQGRPVGAEIGRQNAFFLGGLQLSRFPWVEQMWCLVLLVVHCRFHFIFWLSKSQFTNWFVSSCPPADHGEQDSFNPAGRAAGEEELEGGCCGDHRGGCRGNQLGKCFTLCMCLHLTLSRPYGRRWGRLWMPQSATLTWAMWVTRPSFS